MPIGLLGTHDRFAWQVGSDGTYVFTSGTNAEASTYGNSGIFRYDHATGLANTEGTGRWVASTVGRTPEGTAVAPSVVWRQETAISGAALELDSIHPTSGAVTGVATEPSFANPTLARAAWNPTTGTVWTLGFGALWEWVAGVPTARTFNISGISIPHVDSAGAVWFARDGSSNLYEVCRYSAGSESVVTSYTRVSPLITICGAQRNPGVVYNDEFVYSENGVWKQVDAAGVVTSAAVMFPAGDQPPNPSGSSGAGLYIDSYSAGPDNNGGFVISFEGTVGGSRETWGFPVSPTPAGRWRIGRVGWPT